MLELLKEREYRSLPMKTALTAQQLAYFRDHGHIRFEQFPADLKDISEGRDLWRHNPVLKKLILHKLGPIALELTGQKSLRLACDQWLESPPKLLRMQDYFCFQGLALLFILSEGGLDIFEPSSLASHFPDKAYLAAFAKENARLIENTKDAYNLKTRNLGYVFGDRLRSEFHPLIHH